VKLYDRVGKTSNCEIILERDCEKGEDIEKAMFDLKNARLNLLFIFEQSGLIKRGIHARSRAVPKRK